MVITSAGEAQWDWGVQQFRLLGAEPDVLAPDIDTFAALVPLTAEERQALVDERAYCDDNGIGL